MAKPGDGPTSSVEGEEALPKMYRLLFLSTVIHCNSAVMRSVFSPAVEARQGPLFARQSVLISGLRFLNGWSPCTLFSSSTARHARVMDFLHNLSVSLKTFIATS